MDETKPTLMTRLKKAATHPAVMLGIAALSYFGGLKQGKATSEPMDRIREMMGGEIAHAVLDGVNGAKTEYFSEGTQSRMIFNNGKGLETKMAWDTKTGDGILKTSDGVSMVTNKDHQWEEGSLTEAQNAILDGKYEEYLNRQYQKKDKPKKTQPQLAPAELEQIIRSQTI